MIDRHVAQAFLSIGDGNLGTQQGLRGWRKRWVTIWYDT